MLHIGMRPNTVTKMPTNGIHNNLDFIISPLGKW
jgi:hypothetical protein